MSLRGSDKVTGQIVCSYVIEIAANAEGLVILRPGCRRHRGCTRLWAIEKKGISDRLAIGDKICSDFFNVCIECGRGINVWIFPNSNAQ